MAKINNAVPPGPSAPEATAATTTPSALNPATGGDWLTELDLLARVPVSRRTVHEWRHAGKLPYVQLPGSRRVIYFWPDVQRALLRHQKGGGL
jgi:hypothetical protein